MSGPKCSEYSVARNEELLRRARELAWSDAAKVESALNSLQAKASSSSKQSATAALARRPNNAASPSKIESYISSLRRCTKVIDTQVRQEEVSKRLSQFSTSIDFGDLPARKPTEVQSYEQEAVPTNRDRSKAERAELVERILRRLDVMASPTLCEEAVEIGEAILNDQGRARRLEGELRIRVRNANKELEVREKNQEAALELIASLRGLEGVKVDEIRSQLTEVVNGLGMINSALRETVKSVAVEAKQAADTQYVAETLREEISNLGYQVGEDFSTLLVRGGRAEFVRRKNSEYGLSVQVDKVSKNIEMSLVREGDPGVRLTVEQRNKDLAAEKEYCDDVHTTLRALKDKGIENSITRQSPLGVSRVPVLAVSKGRTRSNDSRILHNKEKSNDAK
jgi:hypothetical protein